MHARAIGVENSGHFYLQFVLAVVVEEQCLCTALALVITRARTYWIDVAPIVLCLWMHGRVAIDLAGRRLQDSSLKTLGKTEHVYSAMHAGLGRLHRIALIMNRRCRTGEIVNLIHLD